MLLVYSPTGALCILLQCTGRVYQPRWETRKYRKWHLDNFLYTEFIKDSDYFLSLLKSDWYYLDIIPVQVWALIDLAECSMFVLTWTMMRG